MSHRAGGPNSSAGGWAAHCAWGWAQAFSRLAHCPRRAARLPRRASPRRNRTRNRRRGRYYSVNVPLRDGTTDETFHALFKPIMAVSMRLCGGGVIHVMGVQEGE